MTQRNKQNGNHDNATTKQTRKQQLKTNDMEYHGKLYGKIGNKYFDTGTNSDDFDKLQKSHAELLMALNKVLKFQKKDGQLVRDIVNQAIKNATK